MYCHFVATPFPSFHGERCIKVTEMGCLASELAPCHNIKGSRRLGNFEGKDFVSRSRKGVMKSSFTTKICITRYGIGRTPQKYVKLLSSGKFGSIGVYYTVIIVEALYLLCLCIIKCTCICVLEGNQFLNCWSV